MHFNIFTLLSVFFSFCSAQNVPEFEDRDDLRASYFGSLIALGKRNERLETIALERCTRRFTPGVCSGNHKPVWTFVPFRQNCTERLGCREADRENRFRSHVGCMRLCRTLVMMYTNILHQGHNHTSFQTKNPRQKPPIPDQIMRARNNKELASSEDYNDEDDEENSGDEGQVLKDDEDKLYKDEDEGVPKVFEHQYKVKEMEGANMDVDEFGQIVVPDGFEDKT